ncbi:MAG: family 10 glycosylhydrolase [Candidatus Gastranaerophilales bacterium]|nr:family 10 glycosylhydrolase [Candidatus Gastranaerophilales bacterium]
MKKCLGILATFILLTQLVSNAETSISPALRENLRIKLPEATPQISKEVKKVAPRANLNEQVINFKLSPLENRNFNVVQKKPLENIIYQENQIEYYTIDPKPQNGTTSYYPGLRGPNQLIIYSPAFGLRTGTNEFGTEAIIENNMVVRLNGADSIIPRNGFVISGHGTAKSWITKNIQMGSKVYIDYTNKLLKVYLTPESLIYSAKEKLREVNNIINYYRQVDVLYNDKKANEYLEAAKESLRKAEKKPEKTQNYIHDAMDSLDNAIKNAMPYIKTEIKGTWVRPVETTPHQIEKTVERMYNAGITDIFLETYFHGKTIYPSKHLKNNGVIYQREEFVGFDPLEIWINEAHKRNMKLHIWFECFYVGKDNPQTTPNHILSVYPLWSNKRLMNYDSEQPVSSLSEHNGYFLDPANIQVKEFLLRIIEEIITNYKPDGINLDYIRYPQTVEPTFSNYAQMNWGYTKAARDEFVAMYGIDPINIQYGTGDWELWSIYRQNQISEFIIDVKKLTQETNTLLTAVIFPDLKKSITTKMQNWKVWSFNNYLDGVTPLILTGDKNTAELLLKDVINNTSNYTKIYPGIFVPFMGGPEEDLLTQIHKTREYKTKGNILFDYAHLSDEYINTLQTRIYNKEYDSREFRLKTPQHNYKPQIKIKETKKKKFRKNK